MFSLDLETINYLAVIVAAIATFILGAIWYTALFGKLWVKMNGYTEEEVQQKQKSPPVFFGGMLLSYLVLGLVLAILIQNFQIDTALKGAGIGALIWLGPVAAVGLTQHLPAVNRKTGAYFIDASYQLIALAMMGAILAGW